MKSWTFAFLLCCFIVIIVPKANSFDLNFEHLLTTNNQNFRGYNWCRASGNYSPLNKSHTGKDYSEGTPTSISFGKVSLINPDNHRAQTDNCASGDCRMGNVVILQYLTNNGTYIYALYAHLDSFDPFISVGRYVVPEQTVGILGSTDTDIEHLHFEIKDYNMLGNNITTGWGYLDGCSVNPDDYGYHNPENFMEGSNNQVALPLLSITTATPSIRNYDVYGIVDEALYGYLNLTGNFTRSSIVVRDFFNRSKIGDKGGLDDNHRFLGGTNDNSYVTGIYGHNSYPEGDYLFVAYVQDGSEHRFGYPVKFSVVPQGSFIIDNDQVNADHNSNTTTGGELKYSSINPDSVTYHNVVPGYFLTADLYKGHSNAWAQWKPYRKGNYEIYVYIPEVGPTATSVRYKIKTDGSSELVSDPINQRDNRGQWVKLTSGSQEQFEFTNNGYIGIFLGTTGQGANQDVGENELVAFDAIKFIKQDESSEPSQDNDIKKIFDAVGDYFEYTYLWPHYETQFKENNPPIYYRLYRICDSQVLAWELYDYCIFYATSDYDLVLGVIGEQLVAYYWGQWIDLGNIYNWKYLLYMDYLD